MTQCFHCCHCRPASIQTADVEDSLTILPGYIGEFEIVDDHRGGKVVVELIGRINKCGVISPRFDLTIGAIEQWTSNLLPSRQFGYVVLTTSLGIMDHEEVSLSSPSIYWDRKALKGLLHRLVGRALVVKFLGSSIDLDSFPNKRLNKGRWQRQAAGID